jgi:hypothetical protein
MASSTDKVTIFAKMYLVYSGYPRYPLDFSGHRWYNGCHYYSDRHRHNDRRCRSYDPWDPKTSAFSLPHFVAF